MRITYDETRKVCLFLLWKDAAKLMASAAAVPKIMRKHNHLGGKEKYLHQEGRHLKHQDQSSPGSWFDN